MCAFLDKFLFVFNFYAILTNFHGNFDHVYLNQLNLSFNFHILILFFSADFIVEQKWKSG